MSIKMISPVGKKVMDIRKEDVQLYLGRGYKYVNEPADLETVEMMSPAGKVVIMKKDVGDHLNREGWSLLEPEIPAKDETPEPSAGDETPEPSAGDEPSETPVEDETPILPTDEAPVEESEPELVEADTETTDDVPEGAEEADAELEG